MHKIGELITKDVFFEIHYDKKAKANPYKLSYKYWECGWHRKLINRYADLASCVAYINTYVMEHNEESR